MYILPIIIGATAGVALAYKDDIIVFILRKYYGHRIKREFKNIK